MFVSIPKLNVISKIKRIPNNAIITQAIISIIMLWTMDFESLIYYVAFTLSLFTLITVVGMLKLRFTHGNPKDTEPGVTAYAYLFIVTTASVCIFFIGEKPTESILGVSTALMGLIFWFEESFHVECLILPYGIENAYWEVKLLSVKWVCLRKKLKPMKMVSGFY